MPFTASPMFPGDLYDSASQLSSSISSAWPDTSHLGSARWQQILELGWQGVMIDESAGGVGATLAEFAPIAEAAGRHAMALPLTDRCVVAPLLLSMGPRVCTRELLEQVSAGQASVCPVIDAQKPNTLQATPTGNGQLQLKGVLRGADLTEPASDMVFRASLGEGSIPLLLVSPISALTQNVRYFSGIDGRRTADIVLDGIVVEARQVLLQGQAAKDAMAHAMVTGAVLTCVQTVGALGAMIEQTIEYLSTRTQFGVALSTFQALRHKVVEMYVAYESARGLVRQVTEELSFSPGANDSIHRNAALTKLYLTTVSRMVAESAIQLHGGMGMTVEMPAARLAMHTLMCSLQYGDRLHYLDSLSTQMAADVMAAGSPA